MIKTRYILLAASGIEAQEFINRATGGNRAGIVVVTNSATMADTVDAPQGTPWYVEPNGRLNEEQKLCYQSLEQRLGPVWSGVAFVQALAQNFGAHRRLVKG